MTTATQVLATPNNIFSMELKPALFGQISAETPDMPTARSTRIAARRRLANMRRLENLSEILPILPLPGESVHIISIPTVLVGDCPVII